MTVKIELSDEQVAALKARAAARGLTLEDWFQQVAALEISNNQNPPRNRRYKLAELIQQCDTKAPLSVEDREWFDAPALGREAL
jgi:hypothetical protein